jgi:hypothetical protein
MFLCHTQGSIYICDKMLTGPDTQIIPDNSTTAVEIEQLYI